MAGGVARRQQFNWRTSEHMVAAIKREAAKSDRKLTEVCEAALRDYLAPRGARDAEDLVWMLHGRYASRGLQPTATFEVAVDLTVTASVEPPGDPLTQYVDVVAYRDRDHRETVVELRGHAFDPDFAGVTLRVGALLAAAGTLIVRIEDLAPSLQRESA